VNNRDQKTIIEIVTKYLPKARIILFGSRARKDNTPQSDIDIALDIGKKIDNLVLSTIKELVEESSIPFTVDVLDLSNVSEELRTNIIKDGVVWR
jgi:uncharacterized protein